MTDQTVDDAPETQEEDGAEESATPTRKWSGKRIVLFIVLPLLLIAGGGAGAYFGGLLSVIGLGGAAESAEQAASAEPEADGKAVFFDLPELLVNLNTTGRRASFLKIKVSLELESEDDIPRLEAVMPRIVDNFQVYLRELRAEDLRGSAGLYRLREELLRRVQTAARPAEVNDVLFREMLVQ